MAKFNGKFSTLRWPVVEVVNATFRNIRESVQDTLGGTTTHQADCPLKREPVQERLKRPWGRLATRRSVSLCSLSRSCVSTDGGESVKDSLWRPWVDGPLGHSPFLGERAYLAKESFVPVHCHLFVFDVQLSQHSKFYSYVLALPQ